MKDGFIKAASASPVIKVADTEYNAQRVIETIKAAVTAAETGHLVISTLHTIGAANTVDRIVEMVPQVMDRVEGFIDKKREKADF